MVVSNIFFPLQELGMQMNLGRTKFRAKNEVQTNQLCKTKDSSFLINFLFFLLILFFFIPINTVLIYYTKIIYLTMLKL